MVGRCHLRAGEARRGRLRARVVVSSHRTCSWMAGASHTPFGGGCRPFFWCGIHCNPHDRICGDSRVKVESSCRWCRTGHCDRAFTTSDQSRFWGRTRLVRRDSGRRAPSRQCVSQGDHANGYVSRMRGLWCWFWRLYPRRDEHPAVRRAGVDRGWRARDKVGLIRICPPRSADCDRRSGSYGLGCEWLRLGQGRNRLSPSRSQAGHRGHSRRIGLANPPRVACTSHPCDRLGRRT
jgi:hypothetical protein